MAVGRPLGAKLFIEGKEVPFIGASFVHTVGQASIAYIDLVPHSSVNNIKPRTHVQISVRDYNNAKDEFPYVHAWDGEVFGYSFSKTPGNRSFSISCIDVSSYWDNVLSYFLNPVTSLGKGGCYILGIGLDLATSQKSGIAVVATSASLTSLLYTTISEESKSRDFLSGFAKIYEKITKVNGFYKVAESRLRITDRMVIQSSGKLNELLEQKEAFDWFTDIVSRMGGFTTLRQVVQDLMGMIFHDFTSVPFAARVEVTEKDKGADKYKVFKSVGGGIQSKKHTVGQFIFKPNLYMIPPPVCNIFFPDEYSNFQYSRNFFKEPTRLIYKPELPLVLNTGQVALAYKFEPPSLQHFMNGQGDFSKFQGADDFAVAEAPGHFGEVDTNEESSKVNNARINEGQFLTNEEGMKGVWMAIENMMPAATTFRATVADTQKTSFTGQIARYLFFKKRFESRSLQITSHLKLSVVPGFNILLLDDSDANQSTLAYCSSVTHRVFATEGGYTNVQLSYARTVEEEKVASNNGNDPVVPPWFDEKVFGKISKPDESKAAKAEVASKGPQHVSPPNSTLSDYYKNILGQKGYKALTDFYAAEKTVLGSVKQLLADYRKQKTQGSEVLQDFIAAVTGRDYIRVRDYFEFLGAKLPDAKQDSSDLSSPNHKAKNPKTTLTTDIRISSFNNFLGGAFDPANKDFGAILKLKFKVIDVYQKALKEYRGFRG